MQRDVYSGTLKLHGKEHEKTLATAVNYASSLHHLGRFKEAKSLLCKAVPVARRVLRDSYDVTLKLRWLYGRVLYKDDGATLDDLREAVTTFEEIERIARRVLGGAHPIVEVIERRLPPSRKLRDARVALCACVGDDAAVSSLRDAMEALAPGDA